MTGRKEKRNIRNKRNNKTRGNASEDTDKRKKLKQWQDQTMQRK